MELESALPVEHGQIISLSCSTDHVKIRGSNEAVCEGDTLGPYPQSLVALLCSALGMYRG